jgi:hypothetical protein
VEWVVGWSLAGSWVWVGGGVGDEAVGGEGGEADGGADLSEADAALGGGGHLVEVVTI